jgi:hypothetical protein
MTTPVVLITGALTGIGRATALAFAREAPVSLFPDDAMKKVTNSSSSSKSLAPRPNSCVPMCGTTKMCVIWWIRPSRALVVWTLPSIAPEPKANPVQ